jgi:16S rRNA A1518/A1519 N6-dimethyltransferase RsmA/KsgA/DIM1 with predicted DNA glycosylase/AP lyase activity
MYQQYAVAFSKTITSHSICVDNINLVQVIEEDITKFHIRSHFLPFMKEKCHATKKLAKVSLILTHRNLYGACFCNHIPVSTLQVVSNLPFNVSTEVVRLLLPMGDVFSVVVLMLQV